MGEKLGATTILRNPHETENNHALSATIDLQTEDLRLFLRCVSDGSLTAAARALGLTQAVASRRIQRLEAALGGAVLHRTTRSLRTTAEGERLLGTARAVVAQLTDLERSTRTARDAPSGDVRVSAPVLLGQAVGGTLAAELARLHPQLRLVLSLSNARVDLVREGIDAAFRVGPLPSTTLRAARIATARIGAYGRAELCSKAKRPADLLTLPWVGHSADSLVTATGPAQERWRAKVRFSFVCDDRIILRDAAAAGLGMTLLPTFLGDSTSDLYRAVPDWHFGRVPVHVVWLPEAQLDPRVRAVVDVMTAWGRRQRW